MVSGWWAPWSLSLLCCGVDRGHLWFSWLPALTSWNKRTPKVLLATPFFFLWKLRWQATSSKRCLRDNSSGWKQVSLEQRKELVAVRQTEQRPKMFFSPAAIELDFMNVELSVYCSQQAGVSSSMDSQGLEKRKQGGEGLHFVAACGTAIPET